MPGRTANVTLDTHDTENKVEVCAGVQLGAMGICVQASKSKERFVLSYHIYILSTQIEET